MQRKMHNQQNNKMTAERRISRPGFTLIELLVAMILLGIMMSTMVPLLGWSKKQREAANTRMVVVQETANILERFSARPWRKITPETAETIQLSDRTATLLSEPLLKITVIAVASDPPSKRINVELSWKNRQGKRLPAEQLTSFIYQPVEVSDEKS